MSHKPRPLAERFWEKVAIPPDPEDCWLWIAAIDPSTGYGRIGLGGRSEGVRGAHQVAFMLWHGTSVPKDREICHSCNNRWCVNPLHLSAGTRSDNLYHRYRDNKPKRSWWHG